MNAHTALNKKGVSRSRLTPFLPSGFGLIIMQIDG
jgi:hypothetical protein